jgi:hypothetical protein
MKLCLQILLISAVALTGACRSTAPVTESAQTAAAPAADEKEKAAALTAARSNPLDGITSAFQKALGAQSFRAQLESTAEGRTSQVTYEFVAPDRFRMRNGPTEMIVIGDAAYLKTLGSWQKAAPGLQNQVKAIRDPQIIENIKQATAARFVQADALNGQPMLVYEYTSTNLLGIEGATNSKTWVGMFDGLPYKSEFEGMLGSVKTKRVMVWSGYNADLKIEAPIKE